jgi:hypothetical protein
MDASDTDLISWGCSFGCHHRKALPDDHHRPEILAEITAPGATHPGHGFVSSS